MRAWIARMTEDNIDQSAIEKAGEILKNGGLAAFPTETVYGLGGNALDAKASEKIYAAKGRPSDNPLIVHIGRMEDLETVAANVPESARKLAAACWPGPLTMIFEKTNAVPLETTGGLTSVAVRYPSYKKDGKDAAASWNHGLWKKRRSRRNSADYNWNTVSGTRCLCEGRTGRGGKKTDCRLGEKRGIS